MAFSLRTSTSGHARECVVGGYFKSALILAVSSAVPPTLAGSEIASGRSGWRALDSRDVQAAAWRTLQRSAKENPNAYFGGGFRFNAA
jgi:hypothetical protein